MPGKYGLIYADPPWWYNPRRGKRTAFGRGVWGHYKPMKTAAICAMRPTIDELAATNCVLAMWVTGYHMIISAPKVLDAWGFRYGSMGPVWRKSGKSGKARRFPGHYFSQEHEYVIIAVRGSMPPAVRLTQQAIDSPMREHSRKPDEVRKMLEAMYPDAAKVEMFARQRFDGWDAWGNECDKFEKEEAHA